MIMHSEIYCNALFDCSETHFSLIFGETILGSFADDIKIGKPLGTCSRGLLRKLPHRRDETILRTNR